MGTQTRNDGGMGLLPGTDAIFSSYTPPSEQAATRPRDRCYFTRPRFPRARSGRSVWSATSDSVHTYTTDANYSPEELKVQREQQEHTNKQLQELGYNAKSHCRRRWWNSSDEGPQTPEPLLRRLSFNPLKRNNKSSDQAVDKSTTQAKKPHLRKWRSKQFVPYLNKPAGLDVMVVPPVFTPPGVSRVPTPPMLDADEDVKSKLADFYFDVQAGEAPRRKEKPTVSGLWDSDALLISLTSDINRVDEDEEDEGPEGIIEDPAHRSLYFELNGTPGLTTGVGSIRNLYGTGPMNPNLPSPVLQREAFFRIPHEESALFDQRLLDTLARQEEVDRRKFEWMVPEHLPTSPLCPLHEIYKGPWTGLCYWHGRRQSGSPTIKPGDYASGRDKHGNLKPYRNMGKPATMQPVSIQKRPALRRGSRGWPVGVYDMPPLSGKKRRLASLSM